MCPAALAAGLGWVGLGSERARRYGVCSEGARSRLHEGAHAPRARSRTLTGEHAMRTRAHPPTNRCTLTCTHVHARARARTHGHADAPQPNVRTANARTRVTARGCTHNGTRVHARVKPNQNRERGPSGYDSQRTLARMGLRLATAASGPLRLFGGWCGRCRSWSATSSSASGW